MSQKALNGDNTMADNCSLILNCSVKPRLAQPHEFTIQNCKLVRCLLHGCLNVSGRCQNCLCMDLDKHATDGSRLPTGCVAALLKPAQKQVGFGRYDQPFGKWVEPGISMAKHTLAFNGGSGWCNKHSQQDNVVKWLPIPLCLPLPAQSHCWPTRPALGVAHYWWQPW